MASKRRKNLKAGRASKNARPPKPTHATCGTTGKRSYATKTDALIVASRASHTAPQRAYRCQFCELWHLTSKPKRGRA